MNRLEHLLTTFSEECAELQQAISKSLRFGLNDGYPGTNRSNLSDMRLELNQLIAMVEMLEAEGIDLAPDHKIRADKKVKVEHYLEYAKERGTLYEVDDLLASKVRSHSALRSEAHLNGDKWKASFHEGCMKMAQQIFEETRM